MTLASNSGNLAKTGHTFAGWKTAANGSGTDYAAGATCTEDVALSLYAHWTAGTFTLTITNGSGSGEYEAGTVVDIQADAPAEGMVFYRWVGDVQYVGDVYSSSTTLTIPAGNVTVTATYRSTQPPFPPCPSGE